MKTIKVKTTQSNYTSTELWYVYNSYLRCGVAYTKDQQDAVDSGQTVIRAIVTVSNIYIGTFQDWDRYIIGCIEDTLISKGLAIKDADGDIYIV